MKKVLMGFIIVPLSVPCIICGFVYQIVLEAFMVGRQSYIDVCRKL